MKKPLNNISCVISTSKVSLVHSKSYVLFVCLMIITRPRHPTRHTCPSGSALNAFIVLMHKQIYSIAPSNFGNDILSSVTCNDEITLLDIFQLLSIFMRAKAIAVRDIIPYSCLTWCVLGALCRLYFRTHFREWKLFSPELNFIKTCF